MSRKWDEHWTYDVVEEFLSMATILASDPTSAIDEMRHLITVINISGSNLSDAAKIIGEYYDKK